MERSKTFVSGRYRTALCLCLIFSCCLMSRAEGDIYFNVKRSPTAIQNDNVYVSLDLFKQFHQCLCDDTVNVCTANYSIVNNRYEVNLISSAYLRTVANNPTIFQCQKPKAQFALRCERVPADFGTCLSGSVNFFKLSTSSSCSDTCFGFYWRFDKESFGFSHADVVGCDGCGDGRTTPTHVTARSTSSSTTTTTTTTTSTTTTPKPVPDRHTSSSTTATTTTTTTTTTLTSTSPTNSRDRTKPNSVGKEEDKTLIIVGAVLCVIAVIIIIVILSLFLWKRRKLTDTSTRDETSVKDKNIGSCNKSRKDTEARDVVPTVASVNISRDERNSISGLLETENRPTLPATDGTVGKYPDQGGGTVKMTVTVQEMTQTKPVTTLIQDVTVQVCVRDVTRITPMTTAVDLKTSLTTTLTPSIYMQHMLIPTH